MAKFVFVRTNVTYEQFDVIEYILKYFLKQLFVFQVNQMSINNFLERPEYA